MAAALELSIPLADLECRQGDYPKMWLRANDRAKTPHLRRYRQRLKSSQTLLKPVIAETMWVLGDAHVALPLVGGTGEALLAALQVARLAQVRPEQAQQWVVRLTTNVPFAQVQIMMAFQ